MHGNIAVKQVQQLPELVGGQCSVVADLYLKHIFGGLA